MTELPDQRLSLPREAHSQLEAALQTWEGEEKVRRLWQGDSSLWTGGDEGDWLGWLEAPEEARVRLAEWAVFAREVVREGFSQVVVLGMGGASLGAGVLGGSLQGRDGVRRPLVLDSTDPRQIKAVEEGIVLERTLFVVASKSGTTLETDLLGEHFYRRVASAAGEAGAGRQFVAITGRDSPLHRKAEDRGFRRVFCGRPDIGGRFSVLSPFGLVPAAAAGLGVAELVARAEEMAARCGSTVPAAENPGVILGVGLAVLTGAGRDKVTLVTSPALEGFAAWLEQLVAESTGKGERTLLPVIEEELGPPEVYGDDRVFVQLRLDADADPAQGAALDLLAAAGHPLVTVRLRDPADLGGEFFRWQLATAVAGAVVGIHPFNQPDVEASKEATRQLMTAYAKQGSLPPEEPMGEDRGIQIFAADRSRPSKESGSPPLVSALRAHLGGLDRGDYFAILAFLEQSPDHQRSLQALRHLVRDTRQVATCLGFGPRFLHSTGQAHKGGRSNGVFLQLTCDDAVDLPVPGEAYTFGVVKAAQARGDFQILARRGRRLLRLHLGDDVEEGLEAVRRGVEEAVAGLP